MVECLSDQCVWHVCEPVHGGRLQKIHTRSGAQTWNIVGSGRDSWSGSWRRPDRDTRTWILAVVQCPFLRRGLLAIRLLCTSRSSRWSGQCGDYHKWSWSRVSDWCAKVTDLSKRPGQSRGHDELQRATAVCELFRPHCGEQRSCRLWRGTVHAWRSVRRRKGRCWRLLRHEGDELATRLLQLNVRGGQWAIVHRFNTRLDESTVCVAAERRVACRPAVDIQFSFHAHCPEGTVNRQP
mmetsp:Transcript_30716/g.80405  ORF Transcript_30716/g.80405 Transcript_30716/m.80405 type:complete len:238 (+) Transcript_30716:1022-1735(+)